MFLRKKTEGTGENLKPSRIIRGILRDGEARFFLCDTLEIVQKAREIHEASNTCSVAMGRMLSAVAMMGIGLKDEKDRISVTINGHGPGGAMTAVAGANGCVKITVQNPECELPLKSNGSFDVGGFLGKDGQLTVVRSSGYSEPYVGRTDLVSGEVAEDFAMYYLESEQIPSLCALGTHVRESVESSAGILIQAMPSCSAELLDQLDIRTELFSGISQMAKDMELEEIVEGAFRGLDAVILEEQPVLLQCDCSREYIERVLLSVGEKELRSMIEEEGQCEVCCHYCRKKYRFNREQLERLLEEGVARDD